MITALDYKPGPGSRHIGVTGTQKGGTAAQLYTFKLLIKHGNVYRGGVCIGADEQTAVIAKAEGLYLIGHPPIKLSKKSKLLDIYDEMCEPKEYLDRDVDIAVKSSAGIGVPKGFEEEMRSGTWYTIRRFRGFKVPSAIIWPDGSILFENGGAEFFQA
jgi:hypothetical protein